MPPTTDLGNQPRFSTPDDVNEVPAPKLYRRHVRVWTEAQRCWHLVCFLRYHATAAVLTAAGHTRSLIKCSSVLLSTVSSILTITSLIGINVSSVTCLHSDRAHWLMLTAFFATQAFHCSSIGRSVVHPYPSFATDVDRSFQNSAMSVSCPTF